MLKEKLFSKFLIFTGFNVWTFTTEQETSSDLKEFGVDADEPDLFSAENQSSNSQDLPGTSEEFTEEDDLEIPAFLRRQKN